MGTDQRGIVQLLEDGGCMDFGHWGGVGARGSAGDGSEHSDDGGGYLVLRVQLGR